MSCAQRPPKVAVFLPSLQGGGAERAMATLANGFAQRGLLVDMVLATAEGPYLAELSSSVRVVDLGAKRVLLSLPALVRYLRHERPDALLSALSHANVAAIAAHRLAGSQARLVVSERIHVSTLMATVSRAAAYGTTRLMRWTYRRADAVVTVSMGVADDLIAAIGIPRDRLRVVYNPVVDDRLLALSAAPVHHPWFTAGAPPVVLATGRLTAQKDFPTLLRAFAVVRAQRPVRLIILGEGELRGELESLAVGLGVADDVALPGFVENPFAWMRRASLFALSSAFEGLPGVLIQAMACGTPVVSTDCPSGPSEILENGRWGRLVPVGNVQALADAMLAALDDSRPPDVAARAREFGLDQAVAGYLDALGVVTP